MTMIHSVKNNDLKKAGKYAGYNGYLEISGVDTWVKSCQIFNVIKRVADISQSAMNKYINQSQAELVSDVLIMNNTGDYITVRTKTNDNNALKQLLKMMGEVTAACFCEGILLNGAIAYGDIEYDDMTHCMMSMPFYRAKQITQQTAWFGIVLDESVIYSLKNGLNKTIQLETITVENEPAITTYKVPENRYQTGVIMSRERYVLLWLKYNAAKRVALKEMTTNDCNTVIEKNYGDLKNSSHELKKRVSITYEFIKSS